ncbi:plexin-A4 isoform X1, partial [Tachysurus ichikawai]
CTRKEKCERSSEPRRFTSDIKQCVRLSVHPSNISVSQYSVTCKLYLSVQLFSFRFLFFSWLNSEPIVPGPQNRGTNQSDWRYKVKRSD